MALPSPEPGLVISYSYLWQREHEEGREEVIKDRPCVIVIAVRNQGGQPLVTVAPVTHSAPSKPGEGVELPFG